MRGGAATPSPAVKRSQPRSLTRPSPGCASIGIDGYLPGGLGYAPLGSLRQLAGRTPHLQAGPFVRARLLRSSVLRRGDSATVGRFSIGSGSMLDHFPIARSPRLGEDGAYRLKVCPVPETEKPNKEP